MRRLRPGALCFLHLWSGMLTGICGINLCMDHEYLDSVWWRAWLIRAFERWTLLNCARAVLMLLALTITAFWLYRKPQYRRRVRKTGAVGMFMIGLLYSCVVVIFFRSA